MKRIIRSAIALIIGLGLGVAALAGLETVTTIQDLNTSWPLGSDLASTSDDHIRNIKTALKNTIPATVQGDILYNGVTANEFVALNKSTSATRYLSNTGSSNAPAWAQVNLGNGVTGSLPSGNLDLTMSPTWSGQHTFTTGSTTIFQNDTAQLRFKNTAGSIGGALGTVNAVTGSGSTTDLAIGLNNTNTNFYNNASTNINMQVAPAALSGRGPIAAALVDMTPDTGTATLTITGCTASPTGTLTWARVGKVVTATIPAITCTSNATSFTMTGWPSAIQPAALTQNLYTPFAENAGSTLQAAITVTAASGTLTFGTISATGTISTTGWTASGAKGLSTAQTVSFQLN